MKKVFCGNNQQRAKGFGNPKEILMRLDSVRKGKFVIRRHEGNHSGVPAEVINGTEVEAEYRAKELDERFKDHSGWWHDVRREHQERIQRPKRSVNNRTIHSPR